MNEEAHAEYLDRFRSDVEAAGLSVHSVLDLGAADYGEYRSRVEFGPGGAPDHFALLATNGGATLVVAGSPPDLLTYPWTSVTEAVAGEHAPDPRHPSNADLVRLRDDFERLRDGGSRFVEGVRKEVVSDPYEVPDALRRLAARDGLDLDLASRAYEAVRSVVDDVASGAPVEWVLRHARGRR